MNSFSTLPKMPNLRFLYWIEKAEFLSVGFVSTVCFYLSTYDTLAGSFFLPWSILNFSIFITLTLSILFHFRKLSLLKWLNFRSNNNVSTLVFFYYGVSFLLASLLVPLINLIGVAPLFIFPFALFLRNKSITKSRTPSVLKLSLILGIILSTGSYFSLYNYPFHPLDQISSLLNFRLISILLWTFFSPLYIYYLYRRSQIYLIQNEAIQDATISILSVEDPWGTAKEVVEIVQLKAGLGDRVVLLSYDKELDQIRVIASTQNNDQTGVGFELPKGKGVTRRSIYSKKIDYVPNVRSDKDFVPGPFPNKGSEVSVPIFGDERNVVGTLNVQSNLPYAFSSNDITIISKFADVISQWGIIEMKKSKDILSNRLQELYSINQYDNLIWEILLIAKSIYSDPLIWFYRLAIGTNFPLSQPFLIGDFYGNNPHSYFLLLKENPNLLTWINKWESVFIRNLCDNPEIIYQGLESEEKFFREENISSLCFLPVGTQSSRLGVLLFFFRDDRVFSLTEKGKYITFAREIWPYIIRLEYLETFYRGFSNPGVHFHSPVAEVGLGRGAADAIFDDIYNTLIKSNRKLLSQVREMHRGINKLISTIEDWDADNSVWYSTQEQIQFKEKLSKICDNLQQRYSGVVIREIDDCIEDLSLDMKNVLLTLIREPIRNSLSHGEASQVIVKLSCKSDNIMIDILDNGKGFNPNHYTKDIDSIKPGSLYWLNNLAQLRLGAKSIKWLPTKNNRGTHLLWEIPTLPQKID